MNDNIFKDLILEADAASDAGESERTWARRRKQRAGPAFIKFGRKIFYRPPAIRDWVLEKEVKPRRGRPA